MDEGLGVQSVEDFWGLELSSKRKKMEWQLDSEDECEDDLEKTLELRQACLGATAKEGERNVVEVTADDEDGEEVTHAILSMRVGGTEQTQLFLTLKPPVKFELVAGSGPVHLVGTLTQVLNPWFTGSDEESDSEEKEELSSPEVKKKETTTIQSKKRPASSPLKKLVKVAKRSKKEEESEEESGEEEDSMDVSTSSAEPGRGKEKALKGGKKGAEEEEESEDDEEDEEEDDDSEEEDEDTSEEESEEEEEEVKKPVKKPQMNGKLKGKPMPGKANKLAKTPQPNKPMASKLAAKGSQSAPTTPKTMDKASKKPTKALLGLDQIKQKLLKMSNLPKKMEKFNNFVSHSFKVTDDSEKKQLWEFVQKNNLRK